MTRLTLVDPDNAAGETTHLLTAVHKALGVVPNLVKVLANNPAVLEGYLNVVGAKRTLSADTLIRIALLVAQENKSGYGLAQHSFLGTKVVGLPAAEVARARRGEAADPLNRAVLELAAAVLKGAVSDDHVAVARQAGLSDRQIVEIVAQVALHVFTAYLTQVADIAIDWPLN
ncbi:carboxymuconolactone decarboxylase family protein [Nonomuraea soli]|uniref:Alkylhydroperoxidase family enzyme n=1 Tax=Nonomuraea soli TaxID=1032476 RepID=A0A7W0HR82_9ACTN|nr:carboxymuconolactone decarboxylase family protein [Nonomuraea soli]MBA2892361.1 alkylhydroperoxidase family enzyme [Nonomuraea soli]